MLKKYSQTIDERRAIRRLDQKFQDFFFGFLGHNEKKV
jgi:hypothetical protein